MAIGMPDNSFFYENKNANKIDVYGLFDFFRMHFVVSRDTQPILTLCTKPPSDHVG